RINVARTDNYVEVKDRIAALYVSKPSEFKTLFLLGKVPVPYSGFLAPDGHIPDHFGAWPADVYYGEFDLDWMDEVSVTDYTISGVPIDSNSVRKANLNMAGDGKFDIDKLDEDVELMIGRVDLSNMTAFGKTEKELLKQYLDKDHNYRVGLLAAPMRGLVDNNFGYMSGEAFASTGWRNMAPLVGKDSLKEIDWFNTLSVDPYLWAYGTGGGNNEGAGGVGSTSDFATRGSKAIFTMLFGSYFGDWNTSNNFLRAPLASEYGLSCAWSGRPYWHFFPMGLGQSLGYCARLTQNNTGSYLVSGFPTPGSAAPNSVHIALMGDPTLRLYPVMPPSNMTTTTNTSANSATLGWDHSTDPNFDGYQIYRSSSKEGAYKLLATVGKQTKTYTDIYPLDSINYYFVHTYRLETSPSGSYYNLSPGVWNQSNPLKNDVIVEEFYHSDKLTALQTSLSSQITLTLENTSDIQMSVVDATGKTLSVVTDRVLSQGEYRFELPYTNLSSGVYFVRVIGTQKPLSAKILVVK
ncbi:MAG TPA: T9SS type A sorting domain-containing protein, partial [Candidatus Kapabacteria bacterium]